MAIAVLAEYTVSNIYLSKENAKCITTERVMEPSLMVKLYNFRSNALSIGLFLRYVLKIRVHNLFIYFLLTIVKFEERYF